MPKEPDVILDTFKIETLGELLALVVKTPMIVVYKNTADYGEKYVARLWKYRNLNKKKFNSWLPQQSHEPTKYVVTADSMAEISNKMPWFLNYLPRYPEDDPCIVGVYL